MWKIFKSYKNHLEYLPCLSLFWNQIKTENISISYKDKFS